MFQKRFTYSSFVEWVVQFTFLLSFAEKLWQFLPLSPPLKSFRPSPFPPRERPPSRPFRRRRRSSSPPPPPSPPPSPLPRRRRRRMTQATELKMEKRGESRSSRWDPINSAHLSFCHEISSASPSLLSPFFSFRKGKKPIPLISNPPPTSPLLPYSHYRLGEPSGGGGGGEAIKERLAELDAISANPLLLPSSTHPFRLLLPSPSLSLRTQITPRGRP